MRAVAWLLVITGIALVIASFFIAARTGALPAWSVLTAGFCLTVVGIVLMTTRKSDHLK